MIFDLINDKPKGEWGDNNGYCGPRAIAFLTGVPLSRAEHMIRRCRKGGYRDRNGRKLPIKGTYSWEVKRVLERLGCKITPVRVIWHSLGDFLEDTKHLEATYLVNVTGHYTVAHKGAQTDKNLRPKRRIKRLWQVEAPAVPKYTADDPIGRKPSAPKPKPDIRQVRYQRTLAKIKLWQAKEKRAKTALRKLNAQRKYYERTLPPKPKTDTNASAESIQPNHAQITPHQQDAQPPILA